MYFLVYVDYAYHFVLFQLELLLYVHLSCSSYM